MLGRLVHEARHQKPGPGLQGHPDEAGETLTRGPISIFFKNESLLWRKKNEKLTNFELFSFKMKINAFF